MKIESIRQLCTVYGVRCTISGCSFLFFLLIFVEKQHCDKHKGFPYIKRRRSSNGIKFLLFKYVNWNLRFDIFIFSHQQEKKTFALSMHFGRSFNLNHPSDCETQWKPATFSMLNEGANELVKRRIKEEKKKNEWKQWYYLLHVGVSFKIWTDNVFFYSVSGSPHYFFFIIIVVFSLLLLPFRVIQSRTHNKRLYEKRRSKCFGSTVMRHGLVWYGMVWPVFKYVMLFPLFIIFIQVLFHSTNYNTKQNVFVIFELSGGWFFGWTAVSPDSGKCIGYIMGNFE